MLDPKKNRIDYGEQLNPPDGYELEQAIGTTYSLDLEVLMLLPVALFYSQKLDGSPDELRYDMLDAITKAAEKITIYYQKGQLKVPQKYHFLMAYLEKGIEAVMMPNYLSSFHPKVWVVRYVCKGQPAIYRLLVTSRNLTFSRDWDVAFSTDGLVTNEEQPMVKPLFHFLNFLSSTGEKKIEATFLKDLMKVKFELPDRFESLSFMPIGIKNHENGKNYTNSLTENNSTYDEMLIISPFVDKKTLDKLKQSVSRQPFLLSRKEELDTLSVETLKQFNCWNFSRFIQNAENCQELSEENVLPLEQNLHAKLYITMKDKIPYWYLGSANCSDPAQGRNIEFMVKLKGTSTAGLRARDVINVLTGKDQSEGLMLFMPYDFNSRIGTAEQKKIDLDIRKIKYDLAMLPLSGKVELIEEGVAYNLIIDIDARNFILEDSYIVQFKPLPEKQKKAVVLKTESTNIVTDYTGYSEALLSIFLIFEIWKDNEKISQFLMPMDIELPVNRLNRIFSLIINNKDNFLKYLNFLLTGEEAGIVENIDTTDEGYLNGSIEGSGAIIGTQVFEKLLIAASRYPDKLKSIDELIRRLKSESDKSDEKIITEEFENFWKIFQTRIKSKK